MAEKELETEEHKEMLEGIENLEVGGEITIETEFGDKLNRPVRQVNYHASGDTWNSHQLLLEKCANRKI